MLRRKQLISIYYRNCDVLISYQDTRSSIANEILADFVRDFRRARSNSIVASAYSGRRSLNCFRNSGEFHCQRLPERIFDATTYTRQFIL